MAADRDHPGACLNCESPLTGEFCARCGQRVIPPYPTIHEMFDDAWEEFGGWDGRFLKTVRTLFLSPGALTRDALEGRRARYVKPLRLYLTASLIYFLIAASAPNLRPREINLPGDNKKYDIVAVAETGGFTDAQKTELKQRLTKAPWWAKAMIEPMIEDVVGFQQRMAERMPHVFFVLVPVFACLLAVFYRRRRYMQHLTFALHLHAFLFLTLAVVQLSSFARNIPLLAVMQVLGWVVIVSYTVVALRRVYGGGLGRTMLKTAGLAILYSTVVMVAVIGTFLFTILVR